MAMIKYSFVFLMCLYLGYRICFLFHENNGYKGYMKPGGIFPERHVLFEKDKHGGTDSYNGVYHSKDLLEHKLIMQARKKLLERNYKATTYYVYSIEKTENSYQVSFRGACLHYNVEYTLFRYEVDVKGDDCPDDEVVEVELVEIKRF